MSSGRFGHTGLIHIPPALPNYPKVTRFDSATTCGMDYRCCRTAESVALMSLPSGAQEAWSSGRSAKATPRGCVSNLPDVSLITASGNAYHESGRAHRLWCTVTTVTKSGLTFEGQSSRPLGPQSGGDARALRINLQGPCPLPPRSEVAATA